MELVVFLLAQISSNYPGDAGIENHPDVVYVEKFDEASLSTVTERYTEVLNAAGMMLDTDLPAGSPAGGRSLRITATGGLVNLPVGGASPIDLTPILGMGGWSTRVAPAQGGLSLLVFVSSQSGAPQLYSVILPL